MQRIGVNWISGRGQEWLYIADSFSFPQLLTLTFYLGLVRSLPMQENKFRGRMQEGLYIAYDFSPPKLFTLTKQCNYEAEYRKDCAFLMASLLLNSSLLLLTWIRLLQPMQENRFRGKVQEGLYITDAFS